MNSRRTMQVGGTEAGVSVYDLDKSGQPIAPEESEWGEVDMRDRLKSDDPKFLLFKGQYTGEGGDGEPLLQQVRAVGLWPRDFSPSGQITSR